MNIATVVFDGNNLCKRCFHANFKEGLSVKADDGTEFFTGMIHSVFMSLIRYRRKFTDARFVLSWDKGHNYRKSIDPTYKQSREEGTWEHYDIYHPQKQLLTKLFRLAGIDQIWIDGEESDDVFKTYCKDLQGKTIVVTGDHDIYQIIDQKTFILLPKKNEDVILTPGKFKELFGIEPDIYVDVMSLTGCSGDDVAGIYGIGEKKAIQIINTIPNIVQIAIENPSKARKLVEESNLTKGLKGKLLENDNIERISHIRKLVELHDFGNERISMFPGKRDKKSLEDWFTRLQFSTLLRDENWKVVTSL